MASQDWLEKDFYRVLGVDKGISEADLKKTYRKLARQFHPDSNQGDAAAEARFKEISEAYSVLSDATQRAEYDQIRALGAGGARFTAPGAGGQGGNFEDIFGGLFTNGGGQYRSAPGGYGSPQYGSGGFEDILGGMFGGGAGAQAGYGGFQRGPQRGRDLSASTTLGFSAAINGETVRLQTAEGKPLNVKIPAGVADGQKIKLRGKGEPSPNGGEAGDLILTVAVRPHPVFERKGQNLRIVVPITFPEAALGATVEVPTLTGELVRVKVPAGTPSGRVLRVKGRGVSTKKGTGDLLVEVKVVVPDNISGEAKEHLAAFASALGTENPRDELLQKARSSR